VCVRGGAGSNHRPPLRADLVGEPNRAGRTFCFFRSKERILALSVVLCRKMAWLRPSKPFIETWNTPERSLSGQGHQMNAQAMQMTQKMQLYERGGHPLHLTAGRRLARGGARLVAGPLVRIGAWFLTQTIYTPLLAPRTTGRVQSSRNGIVSPPPCCQSYRMHSPPPVIAAHGQVPPHLGARHKNFFRRSHQHLLS